MGRRQKVKRNKGRKDRRIGGRLKGRRNQGGRKKGKKRERED